MISPLTMLVVLATTLSIASPLPEPKSTVLSTSSVTSDKRPITTSSVTASNSRVTGSSSLTTSSASAPKKTKPAAHGLVKAGFEKMVDLNCIGKVDSNGDGDTAFVSKKAAQVAFNGLAHNLNLEKTVKPQNKAGKPFPRRFDVNGAGTNVKALFSKDCPQRHANTTFYQFPVTSTEAVFAGGETTQDRVLALAHGKWPHFSEIVYCGVMTHRGHTSPKAYTTCQKKQGPIEE